MSWTYDSWISEQVAMIRRELPPLVMAGHSGFALYVVPSKGAAPGRLILSMSQAAPEGATDVVRFPGRGSRIDSIPYSSLPVVLRDACSRMPICPTS